MSEKLPFIPFRCVIRTDGSVERLEKSVTMQEIEQLIGAVSLDTVALRQFGTFPLHVMIVDDLGYETKAIKHENSTLLVPTKAKKPINAEATRLYHQLCPPGTTHAIVGDVVIAPDQDYEMPRRPL